jgi:hypothetical protein
VYLGLVLVGATPQVSAQQVQGPKQINERPFRDFAETLSDKIDQKQVDASAPFSITLEAFLTKDGLIDRNRTTVSKSSGDQKMIDVAKDGIAALGDSGYFRYIQSFGVERFWITAEQDRDIFKTVLRAEVRSKEKAMTIVSGLNAYVQIAKQSDLADDEKFLLSAISVKSEQSSFVINIVGKADDFHNLVLRRLVKN